MINKINTVSLDKMNSSSTLKHIMSVEKANEEAKKSPASKMQKPYSPHLSALLPSQIQL